MKYKAILLDADGTILDFEAAEENAVNGLLEQLGVTDPEAPSVYRKHNSECWKMLERGELTQKELEVRRFALFLEHYGMKNNAREVADAYIDLLAQQSIILPGALEAVCELEKLASLAVVTNGIPRVQHGRMDHSPLRPHFGPYVISGEEGVSKPDPRLLYIALEKLGVEPKDALMVGDSLSSDIRAANNAGVDACWINPAHKQRPSDVNIRYEIDHICELPAILRGE